MKRTLPTAVQVLALGLMGMVASFAAPQQAAPPSLKEQLEAQYKVTKLKYADGELTVTEPGTVLVLQLAGIQGVPSTDAAVAPTVYKDGVLHKPSAGSSFGASVLSGVAKPTSVKSARESKALPVGDKVYVSKLDVNVKNDKIAFLIYECGTCNGVDQTSKYKAAVSFQFAKGSLATSSVPDVEDTIAKVFAIDNAPTQAAPQQPAAAPEQPAPAPAPPPSAPALTNDDIIKLVQAKLSASVIMAKIKASACAFDTSADALVKLKQAGVSDEILQAMVEKQ